MRRWGTNPESRVKLILAGAIFLLCFFAYWWSPIHQITDSKYSMLVSQSLIYNHSFALDYYPLPREERLYTDNTFKNGTAYQIEYVGDRLFYYFPPGSSILSVPFVKLFNVAGIWAMKPDGSYNLGDEARIQSFVAAVLMAALVACFFLMGTLLLPLGWSLAISLIAAFGTSIWSTASRAVWGETWVILFLGLAIWILLSDTVARRGLKPVLLGTFLSWSYFCRPTSTVFILLITLYVLLRNRRAFIALAITGAVWLGLFIVYSYKIYGTPLPKYYLPNRLGYAQFWTAVAGNLVSPSRGLLIYVPVLLLIPYLLIRFRKTVPAWPLALTAIAGIAGHLIIVSGFVPWNGGGCYGPRYMTGAIPWLVLLGVLGVAARRAELTSRGFRQGRGIRFAPAVVVVLLVGISVFANGRGAISVAAWRWNGFPTGVEGDPGKVWDWRYPQMLAGLILPPVPDQVPHADSIIDVRTTDAGKFLNYGWSGSEGRMRWTESDTARVVFATDAKPISAIKIRMGPFLAEGKLSRQRVRVEMNGRDLAELNLTSPVIQEYTIKVPEGLSSGINYLTFEFPDSASPLSLGVNNDSRELGIAVETIELVK